MMCVIFLIFQKANLKALVQMAVITNYSDCASIIPKMASEDQRQAFQSFKNHLSQLLCGLRETVKEIPDSDIADVVLHHTSDIADISQHPAPIKRQFFVFYVENVLKFIPDFQNGSLVG